MDNLETNVPSSSIGGFGAVGSIGITGRRLAGELPVGAEVRGRLLGDPIGVVAAGLFVSGPGLLLGSRLGGTRIGGSFWSRGNEMFSGITGSGPTMLWPRPTTGGGSEPPQADEGTPHLSMKAWTEATTSLLNLLWVFLRGQLSLHFPLQAQEKHTSSPLSLG